MRRTRTRPISALLTLATLAGLGVGFASPATAAPAGGSVVLSLTCATLGTIDVVSFENGGPFMPAITTATNQVLVPYAFAFEGTVDGQPVSFGGSRPVPSSPRHDVCSFHIEGDGAIIDVTAWVTYTP
jgi:hypothetical protein